MLPGSKTCKVHSQVGQSQSSATIRAVIPAAGIQATVTVTDWNDLQHSLIYETYTSAGRTAVLVLQDNPQQRQALEGSLFSQLGSAIAGLSDRGIADSLNAKLSA